MPGVCICWLEESGWWVCSCCGSIMPGIVLADLAPSGLYAAEIMGLCKGANLVARVNHPHTIE